MNVEKLLGGLVGSFLGSATSSTNRGKRLKSGSSAVLNQVKRGLKSPQGIVAALGLAFGAYEAYQRSQGKGGRAQAVPYGPSAAPPPVPGAAPAAPPPPSAAPPPVPGAAPAAPPPPSAAPPPVPGAAPAAPPPPSAGPPPVPGAAPAAPPPSDSSEESFTMAVKLIQAMISAAHADGVLDNEERSRILGHLKKSGLEEDEERFILSEMDKPKSIAELVDGVDSHEMKRMMYGLSVAAIDTDTIEEYKYLQDLATALALPDAEVDALNKQFQFKEEQ